MSELKADNTFVFGEECLAYKKSEADKVIVELKERLDTTEKLLYKALNGISKGNKHMMSLARKKNHADYKRCLAMAKWCAADCVVNQNTYKMYSTHRSEFRITHFRKWYFRWLELAEKFKDAK